MLIQGKLLSGNSDLSEAVAIRNEVFVDELQFPIEKEFDELDSYSMHVIVYEETNNKKAVATGRIYYDGTNCEINHIAVLKEYRRKKYGDFATRMLLNKAFISGIHNVFCIVPEIYVDFFKSIGFIQQDIETVENNMIYYRMNISEEDIITVCRKK